MTNSLNELCLQHFSKTKEFKTLFAVIASVSDSQDIFPITFCKIWKEIEGNPEEIYSSKNELERIGKDVDVSIETVQAVIRTVYEVNNSFKCSQVFK